MASKSTIPTIIATYDYFPHTDIFYKHLQFPLLEEFSCTDRCNLGSTSVTGACQCDPDCAQFNDCCVDYLEVCDTNNDTSTLQPDVFSCISLDQNDPGLGSFLLASQCPRDWTDETLRALCERQPPFGRSHNARSALQWPVFDVRGNNYKNVFCAICHGNEFYDLQPWTVSGQDTQTNECVNLESHLSQRTIGSRLRYCQSIVDSCPESFTNDSVIAACKSYSALICPSSTIFKNIHCGYCNGISSFSDMEPCNFIHGADVHAVNPLFRTLWRFKQDEDPRADSSHFQCADDNKEVFDPFLRRCAPLSCSPGLVYDTVTTKCNKSPFLSNAIHGMSCARQESWIVYTNEDGVPEVADDCLERYLDLRVGGNKSRNWQRRVINKVTSTKVILAAGDVICNLGNRLDAAIVESDGLFETCLKDVIEYIHVCKKHPELSYECNDMWYHGKADEFDLVDFDDRAEVFLYRDELINPVYVLDYISYEYDLIRQIYVKIEDVLVCGNKVQRLSCPLITLVHWEYEILENHSLIVSSNPTNVTLEEGEYILFADGRAKICAFSVESNSSTQFFKYFGYLDTVNVIGSCMSMGALLMLFGIHCSFRRLRGFHGRSLMYHCLFMILAQLMPLLSTNLLFSGRWCVVMASWTHFLWLSAFSWMTMISMNMAYSFWLTPWQKPEDREDTTVYRCVLPLVGWSVPLVIVTMCATCHITGMFDFEYNTVSPCWISGATANLIALGVPIGVSVAINTFCLLACVTTICKSRRRSRNVHGQMRGIPLQDMIVSVKVSDNIETSLTYALCKKHLAVKMIVWSLIIVKGFSIRSSLKGII